MTRNVAPTLIVLVVGAVAASGAMAATVGERDPSFNGGNQDFIPAISRPWSPLDDRDTNSQHYPGVTVDADNVTTLAGTIIQQQFGSSAKTTRGLLARINLDGTMDAGFGTGGVRVLAPSNGNTTFAEAAFGIDPAARLTGVFSGDGSTIATRFTNTGATDTNGFNPPNGTVAVPNNSGQVGGVIAAATGPDGATYAAYDLVLFHPQTRLGLGRVDPAGHADTAYGSGGQYLVTNATTTSFGVPAVAKIDSQGRLLLARTISISSRHYISINRFTAAGAVDTTWGTGGEFHFTGPGSDGLDTTDIAIGPGDEVAVAGYDSTAGNGVITVLTPAGVGSGFGLASLPGGANATKLAVQPDGKVLTVGTFADTGDYFTDVARFTTAGQLDPTFNPGGFVKGFNRISVQVDSIGGNSLSGIAISPDASRLTVVSGNESFPGDLDTTYVERILLKDPTLAPQLTRAPAITGTPTSGQQLTCNAGTWTNSPTIGVTWDRAPRATSSNSDPAWTHLAAAGTHYTVQAADVGSRLRCAEHATNANGSADGFAKSIRADAGVPASLAPPTVSGIPILFQPLHCNSGQWSNNPDLGVQWLRNGALIAGATAPDYELAGDDRRTHISCQVSGANDVGTSAPVRSANDVYAVAQVPRILTAPTIGLQSTGPRATDRQLTCGTGVWDEDYGSYEYRWEREGGEIAGATSPTYDATVADLGRNIRCAVYSTNPVGRSDAGRSDSMLVPLPATGERGIIYEAGGFNYLDPANFMAVTKAWKDAINSLVMKRKIAAAAQVAADCKTGANATQPLPSLAALLAKYQHGVYMSLANTCGVLLHAPPAEIDYTTLNWIGDGTLCREYHNETQSYTGSGAVPCPQLRVTVPVLNAGTPPSDLSTLEMSTLDTVKPVAVLWDFDGDGHTDASCDPDSPILRTLPSRGHYDIHAVVVSADSADTGLYSATDLPIDFHSTTATQKGTLRPAQPFACKTALFPPPDPAQPCVTEATIGLAHVTGNICPISARRVPDADLDGLPPDVIKVLEDQALNGALRAHVDQRVLPGDESFGVRAAPNTTPYTATTQISALSTLGNVTGPATVPKAWADQLKKQSTFDLDQAQFAMDQVYVIKGQAQVNGVKFDPQNGALTVIVPSDAGKAIADVQKMTLSNRSVISTLGGIPVGSGPLSTDISDAAKTAIAPTLSQINLDSLKGQLSKLDLGPFKLAGDAKVRMANDGTAFLDAQAELKGAFKAGSGPIRTSVTVRADRNGTLSLQGVHLDVPKALLGAVTVSGLKLDYDGNGLSITGALLFPPINDGIAINKFRVDGNGNFKELDVSYLAGRGQGIEIGPGMFLVKLGGGLSLDPDEFRARAGISMGPSAGGGCPTAGVDADVNVHFGPGPFFVDANSTVELVCIPIGNAHFHADATGAASVSANVHLDLNPFYVTAGIDGELRLPDWQVDLHGEGGIRHVLTGTVKGIISNLGLAGCGRVELFPATPFTDSVTAAGGAGIHFSNGLPPFTYAELLANLDVFTGCSLRGWSPFGRDVARAAAAEGSQSFTLGKAVKRAEALEVDGVGGAPLVTVQTPDGKTLDASKFGPDFTRGADISGLTDPEHARTVLFVRGKPGRWTMTPVAGSRAILRVRHADVLPDPKITGRVGGSGPVRTLTYDVGRQDGQVVHLVEHSQDSVRAIRTVKVGGHGKVRFVVSESRGTKRTVVAEVVQDGMPRDDITLARFSAPSPRPARPRVTLKRRGTSVNVSWSSAQFASTYLVTVATGRGRRFLLTPKGTRRRVSFGGLLRDEGAQVTVVGVTAGGRHGPARTVRLSGALHATTAPASNRWTKAKKKAAAKNKAAAKKKPTR